MPQFRNVGAEAVYVSDLGQTIEPDALAEVPGEISDELEDAYVVASDELGDRAWPKAQWSDETAAPKATETDED